MADRDIQDWIAGISGHSVRVGVAQDAIAAGEDMAAIMQSYGWKTPRMVVRYGEDLMLAAGAAARLTDKVSD